MAFDMGWNFRATVGYVTDDANYGVFATDTHAYPRTYTNGDGQSVNAGWSTGVSGGSQDLASGNDPRIAGDVYNAAANIANFRIDLSSGSAPGAGTYTVDLAFGDPAGSRIANFEVKDDATVVIDGRNGGAGFTTATGHFIDATLADVAATTTWTGATASKAFASTTVNVNVDPDNVGGYTLINHFRLTLQGGAAADVRLEHLAYGIGRGILIGR